MPQEQLTVGIIGGGPAGLAACRYLKDLGHTPIVFEKSDRIGGKSYSLLDGDRMTEMGTCYVTRSDKQTKLWMKESGISLTRLGEARFDNLPIADYIKQAGGPPLPLQVFKFLRALGKLRHRISVEHQNPAVRQEASQLTIDWVRNLNLPKIERALYRIQTAQGYGYLDQTTIGQTAQWCDLDFLLSGALNQLHMPNEGWSEFWSRFSNHFDIRLNTQILNIDRSNETPIITTTDGDILVDAVISTIPMHDFNAITEPTPTEIQITNGVSWQNYTTSLISSPNWFDDHKVTAFSHALTTQSNLGAMIGGRYEAEAPSLGGTLYVTGQYSHGLEPSELREILRSDSERNGFKLEAIINQKTWTYFPLYQRDAVENGLFTALHEAQGQKGTWFSGSTFSHELVSHVVNQSKLVSDMIHRTTRH